MSLSTPGSYSGPTSESSSPHLSEALAGAAIQCLGDQPTAFGVVGNGNIHFVAAFEQYGGRYVSVRHEAGAVAAADAYHRASGRVAIATTTYGPGFTNALTSLLEAQAARMPLVYVMGDIPTTGQRPIDADQLGILHAMGVRSTLVTKHNATAIVREAVAEAKELSAPVVLRLPHDHVVAQSIASDLHTQEPQPAQSGNTTSHHWAAVAEQLQQATRPLIIAGRGVVESATGALVQQLGDRLGALFATTVLARAEVEPQWSLGIAGGFAHRGRVEAFRSADLILVLGASLNKLQVRAGTLFDPDATVIRISDAPHPATAIRVDQQINCDISDALPELLAHLRPGEKTWRAEIGEIPAAESEDLDPQCFDEVCADGRLDPRFVLRRVNQLVPRERTVVTDGGHFLGWVPKYIDAPDSRSTVLLGSAVMTIGLGFASAVGAGVATPQRTTVLIGGDGGMLMGLADAESFFRAVGRSVTVILNDAAYGAEVHQYSRSGIDPATMHLPEVDYAALSAGFGVPSLCVTDPEQLTPGGEVDMFVRAHPRCTLDVKISRLPVADFLREE